MAYGGNSRQRRKRKRQQSGQGNGQGDGGKQKGSALYQQALHDVMLSLRPARQALKRDRRQGMRESRQAQTQVGNAYDQLGPSLDAINSQYQTQTAGIPGQLTEQIGSLSSMLGSNIGAVPDAERAAGTNLIGTLGAGTLEQLASDQSRNAAYGASASRQGEIQRLTDQRNIIGERGDFQEDIRNRRQDLLSGTDQMIRQRQDQLKQDQFNRYLATQGLNIDQGNYQLGVRGFNMAVQQQQYDQAFQQDLYQFIQENPELLQYLNAMLGGG